ncbi:hypothetical protein TNCT_328871 [Trichonephila clavata]|uniref:Uncharacterized protein n=1 Tax=Trichonephila clavata TaxID=2740835 RepID=A0A8X6I1K4_TRICU|nr:hypothetical protein TNCT_328871 [Trichonephila clavata]
MGVSNVIELPSPTYVLVETRIESLCAANVVVYTKVHGASCKVTRPEDLSWRRMQIVYEAKSLLIFATVSFTSLRCIQEPVAVSFLNSQFQSLL